MVKTARVADIEAKMGVTLSGLVERLQCLSRQDREFFIESLLAATSPEYLRSIREAREDYRAGKTVPLTEAFGEEPSF